MSSKYIQKLSRKCSREGYNPFKTPEQCARRSLRRQRLLKFMVAATDALHGHGSKSAILRELADVQMTNSAARKR